MMLNKLKAFSLFVTIFFMIFSFALKAEVQSIDLQKFSGFWLEMARSKNFIQKKCSYSATNYQVSQKEEIIITNLCLSTLGGSQIRELQASLVENKKNHNDNKENNDLYIEYTGIMNFFKPFFKRNFRIFYVNDDYTEAIVGNSDKSSFWLLSRDILTEEQIQQLLDIAKEYGLEDKNLIFDEFNIEAKDKLYKLMQNKNS